MHGDILGYPCLRPVCRYSADVVRREMLKAFAGFSLPPEVTERAGLPISVDPSRIHSSVHCMLFLPLLCSFMLFLPLALTVSLSPLLSLRCSTFSSLRFVRCAATESTVCVVVIPVYYRPYHSLPRQTRSCSSRFAQLAQATSILTMLLLLLLLHRLLAADGTRDRQLGRRCVPRRRSAQILDPVGRGVRGRPRYVLLPLR